MCFIHRNGWIFSAIALCVLIGGLGSCDSVTGIVEDLRPITVELVNTTDFPIEPFLYTDDDDSTFWTSNITKNENRVATGEIPPHTTEVFTFSCERAGTMMTDHAEMYTGCCVVESDNAPIIREKDDFDCYDVISFVFVDTGAEFYTEVEVNGYLVRD